MSEITQVRCKDNSGKEVEFRLDEKVTYGDDTVERGIRQFKAEKGIIKAMLMVGECKVRWFSIIDLKKITTKTVPVIFNKSQENYAMQSAALWDGISRMNEEELNARCAYYEKRKVSNYNLWDIIEIGYLAERARDLGINKGWIVK